MDYIITVFTKDELSQKVKRMLTSSGIRVYMTCRSRAEVIRSVSELDGGILITGFKLADATADMIYDDLPEGFSMLVLATVAQSNIITNSNIFVQKLPVTAVELASSVNILLKNRYNDIKKQKAERKSAEKKIIESAKLLLMERNLMTEDRAHRFIQKKSMDTGMTMVDTAKMILG
ncbi:MAG: ANTAR domain-containing protein [Oscillospiraceae bacterium]|nr:ANTAR domain-containing protein [Oscillospiraceae bacterium]